uniref:Cytochrome P450 CYP4F n=1 Tax=Marphysa sanguinea TaxID=167828 RepID=A0A075DXZ6_MARSA|nr:cytochrome P450 CYP4F [Marphysa sanguinea]
MESTGEQPHSVYFTQLSLTIYVGIGTFLLLFLLLWFYKFHGEIQRRKTLLKEFDGPPGDWFIGHVRHFTCDEYSFEIFGQWLDTHGENIKLKLFWNDVVAMMNPNSIAAVMKTSGPKFELAYSLMAQWIGKGILTSDGPHWFRNRRLLTPAFHFEVLKPYTEVFHQTVKNLIATWREKCNGKLTSLEMFEHFSLVTLESLAKTAFSTDVEFPRKGKKHPYVDAVNTITTATTDRIKSLILRSNFVFYHLTSQGRSTRKALKVAKDFTKDIVKRRREIRRENQDIKTGKYRDFVDMLLDAKDEDGSGLTDEEILDEVDTFMFAGHDTTASGLSWFMYNMARHPEHQERCREEIKEVLAGQDNITWSDLPKLEYLTMCIKESLRIHSPVLLVARHLSEDFKIPDGRVIPNGTIVWLLLNGVHNNPKVWKNPKVFDPYRFSPENSEKRHSHAFVPFSAGPRNCIGQHFALNELKILAAQVLNNFRLEVDPEKVPKRFFSLVLRSEDGVWVEVQPL